MIILASDAKKWSIASPVPIAPSLIESSR